MNFFGLFFAESPLKLFPSAVCLEPIALVAFSARQASLVILERSLEMPLVGVFWSLEGTRQGKWGGWKSL